jgi:predicted lipoprotein with Yx(FWY)xxD motif
MHMNKGNRLTVILAVALIAVGIQAVVNSQPTHAPGASMGAPHYTVVATEGHNLIVTDNHSNTLYFYTIDKDKEVGSELKLRGSVDLNQAGKPEIRPTTHKLDK